MTYTNLSQAKTDYAAAFARWPWWLQWLIFTAVAVILYAPVLGNSFLSDDFLVIKKLGVDGKLNTNGFFRPLSDISLWLSFKIAGINPFIYYFTGIVIRGLSVFFLFRFCLRLQWTNDIGKLYGFSLAAAFLFLTYPFHNESVAWILGRGALMATTLALAALLILTSNASEKWKITGVCCCYFAGLAAYETIFILPLMILAYMLFVRKPARLIGLWQFFLLFTLAIHMVVRIAVSGSVGGEYISPFFERDAKEFFLSGLKAVSRLFIPPVNDPSLFLILVMVAAVPLLAIIVIFYRKIRKEEKTKTIFHILFVFLLITILTACWGGVSTRTSESDRFLEFPAAFLSILASLVIFRSLTKKSAIFFSLLILFIYQIFFLQVNNQHWRLASASVRGLLHMAAQKKTGQKLLVFNLPDNIDGAYVFRNGLKDALVLNHIDTAGIKIISGSSSSISNDDTLIIYWQNGEWIKQ